MTLASLQRKRQILPLGRKGDRPGGAARTQHVNKILKYIDISIRPGMARSLLIVRPSHRERPPVVSVTSEVATSLSFQSAPQRLAKTDPSEASAGFGALVDSNTAAANNNNTAAANQTQTPAPRRADNPSTAQNNTQPSDAATANQAANDSNNPNTASGQASDANNAPNAGGANAGQPSKASADAPKGGTAKSSDKQPSSDDSSATDPNLVAQQGGAAVVPNAISVVIPVVLIPTNVPSTPPASSATTGVTASGNSTAPLAIAAAAIAASSPAIAPPAASSTQISPAGGTASETAASANVTAAATTSAIATAARAAANAATVAPANPQATQANAAQANEANATINGGLTATIAATAPVAPKTAQLKAPLAATTAKTASSTSDATTSPSDSTTASADAANNIVAPPPPGAAKQETGNDATKSDASTGASSNSAPAISAHDRSPTAVAAGHTLTDPSDTGAQAAGTIQPPPQPVAATIASAGALSATAATNAPVPLSGLALEIAASARSGKSRFDIRLDPADLGRIDVRIDVDRNGQVTSHLAVEKPETLSLLRQDAPQLQQALDDAGLKTGNGGLQFSLRDQSSSGQNNGDQAGRNAHQLIVGDEDAIPAAIAGRTYGRQSGSSSGVDIRV